MQLNGSAPNVVVRLGALLAFVLIVHHVLMNYISGKLEGYMTESLETWSKGPDVYMRSLGYAFEWQEFTTTDGVNIKLHHFWKGRNNETGVPVLLQPALFTNGDVWLACNPNDCFPHLLADCGYDIWILNYRGSKYSPYRRENYSYTCDDHIREDLPGSIDFVLEKTKRKNLHLVSYSKSTLMTFGSLSSKPEYNEKVRIHVAMMPVTFTEEPSVTMRVVLTAFGLLSQDRAWAPWSRSAFTRFFDSNWFFTPLHWDNVAIGSLLMSKSFSTLKDLILNTVVTSRVSLHPTFFDDDSFAMGLRSGIFDSLTLHELQHYFQIICAKKLQSFNYSQVPQEYRRNFSVVTYHMSHITAPTLILEASQEFFGIQKDYQRIRAQHKNLIAAYRVKLPNYMHIDGLVGRDKNSIYGRAFAYEMLKFDRDEMNASCHLDFAEDSKNLEKMKVDAVADDLQPSFLSKLVMWPVEYLTSDYCKYYV